MIDGVMSDHFLCSMKQVSMEHLILLLPLCWVQRILSCCSREKSFLVLSGSVDQEMLDDPKPLVIEFRTRRMRLFVPHRRS